ncbi:MAG: Lon protease [Mycoplasmataceae bacterium]|nr:MAG: Lon protease [Mycoplasmataceae bacterium]
MLQKYAKNKGINLNQNGRILWFIGPPGTGKTTFAEIFAEAMGRKLFRINAGGENDANLIIGGKTEHVGAKVGQIINAIRETDSRNPVILIDEIDKAGEKIGESELKNSLLHVLDPKQNKNFTDNYIDVAVDISEITFILTANDERKIPEPLKNRLEIIRLEGYNEIQKFSIGKKIIDETFKKNYGNANRELFEIKEEALKKLI